MAKSLLFGMFSGNKQDRDKLDVENPLDGKNMDNVEVIPSSSRRRPFDPFSPSQKPKEFNLYFMKKFAKLKSIPFSKDNEDAEMMMLYMLMSFNSRTTNPEDFFMALSVMR